MLDCLSLLSCHLGCVMPFQWLMEAVLAGLAWDIRMDYMDDILVVEAMFEIHLQNLEQVFEKQIFG